MYHSNETLTHSHGFAQSLVRCKRMKFHSQWHSNQILHVLWKFFFLKTIYIIPGLSSAHLLLFYNPNLPPTQFLALPKAKIDINILWTKENMMRQLMVIPKEEILNWFEKWKSWWDKYAFLKLLNKSYIIRVMQFFRNLKKCIFYFIQTLKYIWICV